MIPSSTPGNTAERRLRDHFWDLQIETPSWGYGNSGTRFKTFPRAGAARNVWEKVADAAQVHALTGGAPKVALHVPWDAVDDFRELGAFADELGVGIGAINPNLFQDDEYMLGSLCNPDPAVRDRAVNHLAHCAAVMRTTGSNVMSLWLADGTSYSGQDGLARRKARLEEGLRAVYDLLPEDGRLLIEYKPFEPAFYHTDLADWGMAYAMALKCGPRAEVLVDTGHHLQGTNVPHIVAFLLSEKRLGGFHFNARRYADDDLIVGSDNPYELFDIFVKLRESGPAASNVVFMIDQSHVIEPKVEAMVQSVLNCQLAWAKALLVDLEELATTQNQGDVLGAHRLMMDAFQADPRQLIEELRSERGLPANPITELRASGYADRVAEERGTMSGAGGGYPS